MRTAVVTCRDAPPVLEFPEHAFDLVSLTIEGFAIGVFGFTPLTGWDTGLHAFRRERVCERIAVIPFAANENGGLRQGRKDRLRALVAVHPPLGERRNQGQAVLIRHGVRPGVQPALGAPNTAGNIPFSSRLAAARRAFRRVASIINCPGASRSPASDAKI